ncbi:iron-containing redox enzyme family protein [Nocardioides montaniterrae]
MTRLPTPRGPLTEQLVGLLEAGSPPVTALVPPASATADGDDLQLGLWILYEQHYSGFDGVDPVLEWDPDLLRLRRTLENRFEPWLRSMVARDVADAAEIADADGLVAALTHLTRDQPGKLAQHLHRDATREQVGEFLVQRSVYHLKESDPHTFALPRLAGAAKVALAELVYDEYGAGVPEQLHSRLFADAMEAMDLDATYGAHLDAATWQTLAFNNAMSLFGLHRRLRGAAMGHLAAFEMSSSLPCRRYVQGIERLGLGERVARYFDEHVEADAVHEQLASRTICAQLVQEHPALRHDVLMGAAACVWLDDLAGSALMESWA